jgi:hypothetical protein
LQATNLNDETLTVAGESNYKIDDWSLLSSRFSLTGWGKFVH